MGIEGLMSVENKCFTRNGGEGRDGYTATGWLIDRDAIQSGRSAVIENLARKFMDVVRNGRNQVTPQKPPTVARA
jgi:hypothetical protein